MTWTYGADPAASTRDHVRFLVGDIDHDSELVPDEVIDAFLANNSVTNTAVQVLRGLAAQYASIPDRTVGRLRISSSQQAKAFTARADELESSGTTPAAAAVSAAGSVSGKAAADGDGDRIPAYFRTGMMDEHEVHDA